ncbi:MAG: RHS repeat-associated core domain-containing protein, partial [Sulfuricaulis sp.]
RYSYDLKGNRTTDASYDPSSVLTRTVAFSYDLRNHLASITSAGNLTTIVNDAVGNLLSESPNADGVNRTTTHQYDALNHLIRTIFADGGTATYSYDVNDRQTVVTTPNNLTTQYSVDDLGNRLSETSPDRGTIRYTYDAAGNVLTQTDARAQVTSYTYDALNRVATRQSSAAFTKPAFYNYDSCYRGRLCTINDGAMPVMSFGYDGLGRMIYESDNYAALNSQFSYSPGGRLTSITDNSGRTVNYTYDFQNSGSANVGHVVQVSTTFNGTTTVLASNITYYPFGPVAAFGFGNGESYQAQFDNAYRPTVRSDGLYAESITNYDAADNILARTAPGAQSFTYDPLNRLTQGTDNSSGSFGTLAYVYDLNGNRQSVTHNGTPTNYVYSPAGSDWLSQAGSDSRVFNPDGSTASTTSLGSLNYDGYGDLTGVAGATYAYDPFGRRNWKNVGSTWTAFAYGPSGELLYEAGVTNTMSYVYLNGAPLARIDNNSQIYYYHDDHLGSPQAMTNSTGALVWKASYDPFGNATVTTQTITNNLRLPGQYFDSETGLYYNGARYYDPRVGRYISSDPIGLVGGLNTYAYVLNDPLFFIDPAGLARRIKYDIQVIQTTIEVKGPSASNLGASFKRTNHWLLYVDVPDCFVELDRRQKDFDIGPLFSPEPGWSIDKKLGPTTQLELVNRFVREIEYIYGPKPGDECCKGKETWGGYTYEGGRDDLLDKIMKWFLQ